MPTTYTPIRYPGGKTKIYPTVKAIMEANGLIGCVYNEVFAGGAGLAIKLLLKEDVSSIVINDYDRAVYCMWDAIVNQSEAMCRFVDDADLSVDMWLKHREVYRNRNEANPLELAESTLYLNRTNVSGILGGGLIGGLDQKGPYKMDARFNRKTLIKKIRNIAARKSQIAVTNLDAEDFISDRLSDEAAFAYFDPPYVQKGPGLYESSFTEEKHRSLAHGIARCKCKWLVTYDDDDLVDHLYADYEINNMNITYSANERTIGREKIILGPGLTWPKGQ